MTNAPFLNTYSLHGNAWKASLSPRGRAITHVEDGVDSERSGKKSVGKENKNYLVYFYYLLVF